MLRFILYFMTIKRNDWELFFEAEVRQMLVPGARVLDIGSGLRVDADKGNVVDEKRAWIRPLLQDTTYHVMDPVETYHPDIVGDIMHMPIPDASYDAVVCLAVLEHVPRPWDAMYEMIRILKPGGSILLYVPFLYPYHAMPGYYGDYFRFTEDGIRSMCEGLECRVCPVRGPAETLANLCPGALRRFLAPFAHWIDGLRKGSGKQVSGFFAVISR